MNFLRAILLLSIFSLLWIRTAVWIDAAVGYNLGFAFILGGALAAAATAGLYHLAVRAVGRHV